MPRALGDGRHSIVITVNWGSARPGFHDSNINGDAASGLLDLEISENAPTNPGHLTSGDGLPTIILALPAADKYEAGSLYLALW
jgi:hypothetical protein